MTICKGYLVRDAKAWCIKQTIITQTMRTTIKQTVSVMSDTASITQTMRTTIKQTVSVMSDDKCFFTFFKSLVRPHIEYANQVWRPYLMKRITALKNVQRRATKLIP